MRQEADKYEWHRRAGACIAQGYLTNSKRPESLIKGVTPTHIAYGQGAYLYDFNGYKYLDFICGLGTNLLGYSQERLVHAVSEVLRRGWSHSLATGIEVETAEKLKELFPFVDCFKFLKTGGEATSAAIRIARAATGRMRVLSQGYHAWHDSFVSLTPPAIGVPKHPDMEAYADDASLSDVAAVIVEPVITDWSDDRRKWLEALRARCTKAGALLIFDEIITGFRWPRFSVAGFWNINPDLICIGKAMAGGLPLAAVGGKYAVMNAAEYFISSTYAGEILSLAACKATCQSLQTNFSPQFLWERGISFQNNFNRLWPEGVTIEGYPTRGVLKGDPLQKALFMQEAAKSRMLFGPSWFLSFPAAEQASNALDGIAAIMQRLKSGDVVLEGEMPKSPFAQKLRESEACPPPKAKKSKSGLQP